MSAVVSDSSPLNYLAHLSDLDLLPKIYGSLIIPPAVYRELAETGGGYPIEAGIRSALGKWLSVSEPPDPARVLALRRECRLDLGESEAIVIAESLGPIPLLMDEQRGVRCARSRGMVVIRTPLIYADAKILGMIGSIRERLDALRVEGFHLSDRHYEQILRELGEA